ncbi:MAG: hypothetical protein CME45_04480 [Halieaceae bacterium]|nr:hypothetical protein [Halieaceae bacterium]
MAASGFWIGVESMTVEDLTMAAAHPRPVFCGRLSGDRSLQSVDVEADAQAEWHDIALDSVEGQGYLLDLMRQRGPIDHVVLALNLLPSEIGLNDALTASLDSVLAETRQVIEGLIVVTRGAEAVMESGIGAGMTVLYPDKVELMTPLARGLLAFIQEFVAAEAERWAALGLSLALRSGSLVD